MAAEHLETCGCAACVDSYSATGQTDPYGFPVSVSWSLDDRLAHAEWFTPDREPIDDDEITSEMDALVARIEGKRFNSADDLVAYLRRVTGTRDFD